jgi:hypothetical protein
MQGGTYVLARHVPTAKFLDIQQECGYSSFISQHVNYQRYRSGGPSSLS